MKRNTLASLLTALLMSVSFAGQSAGPRPAAPLTAEEAGDLRFMREEEKLARDVYLAMYEQWGLSPFAHITASEQTHMNAMLMLLRKYRLPDPAAGLAQGEFANADLKALYDRLVAQGMRSDVDALRVGGVIEETDIADLVEAMNRADNADIDTTYGRLLCGSRNHLRAFARVLAAMTEEPYQAQVLAQEDVDAILRGSHERCGR